MIITETVILSSGDLRPEALRDALMDAVQRFAPNLADSTAYEVIAADPMPGGDEFFDAAAMLEDELNEAIYPAVFGSSPHEPSLIGVWVEGLRRAVVSNAPSLRAVQRFLPRNYRAMQAKDGTITIVGEDRAGFTLDDYVIPRLGSGLITAREVLDCCDGTGWTGNPSAPCADHYEPNDLSEEET